MSLHDCGREIVKINAVNVGVLPACEQKPNFRRIHSCCIPLYAISRKLRHVWEQTLFIQVWEVKGLWRESKVIGRYVGYMYIHYNVFHETYIMGVRL